MFRDDFATMTWTCHICKEERPDARVSVYKRPLRGPDGALSRSISENIRYCNDRPECFRKARSFSFLRNWNAE